MKRNNGNDDAENAVIVENILYDDEDDEADADVTPEVVTEQLSRG